MLALSNRVELNVDRKAPGWRPGDLKVLLSGWAWGEQRLFGGTTVSEAKLGEGRMFLFGPLIKKRAQPHATFKFLFNGIHLGGATPVRLGGVAD